jgi:glutathione synthase
MKISGDTLDDGSQIRPLSYLHNLEKKITKDGFLAMKFLKNVAKGDKRLIVVDGEIMAASLRLPVTGSWLCNVAQGGYSVKSQAENSEIEIVKAIDPLLKSHGILIYGVDTLVDNTGKRVLSEINTLSIGGFPQSQSQTGKPIINLTLDKIFEYADSHG